MKRTLRVVLLLAVVIGMTIPAAAHRLERQRETHLLRPLAAAGHVVGVAAEYLVIRPMHWVGSRSNLDVLFGHVTYVADDPTYFEWSHGDYKPSVAVERSALKGSGKKMVK